MEPSSDAFTRLQQLIENDQALRAQLASAPGEQEFMRVLSDAAHAQGIALSDSDITSNLPTDNGHSNALDLETLESVNAGSRHNTFIAIVEAFKKLFGI